jgi:uncharacterized lipoprotein YmbA
MKKTPLLALLPLLLATGCGSSPPSRLYVLNPLRPDEVEAREATDVTVRIARVELPRYSLRPEIVTRTSESHLEQGTFDLWGEPLEDGFKRALRTNLALLVPSDRIVFDVLEAREPDHHLMVFVDRFDVDAQGTARLETRWGLTGPDHEAGVDIRYSRFEHAVEDEGYDALVTALSATIADLAREIADAIREDRQPADG